jgi:hypothetical protein
LAGIDDLIFQFAPKSTNFSRSIPNRLKLVCPPEIAGLKQNLRTRKSANRLKPALRPAKAGPGAAKAGPAAVHAPSAAASVEDSQPHATAQFPCHRSTSASPLSHAPRQQVPSRLPPSHRPTTAWPASTPAPARVRTSARSHLQLSLACKCSCAARTRRPPQRAPAQRLPHLPSTPAAASCSHRPAGHLARPAQPLRTQSLTLPQLRPAQHRPRPRPRPRAHAHAPAPGHLQFPATLAAPAQRAKSTPLHLLRHTHRCLIPASRPGTTSAQPPGHQSPIALARQLAPQHRPCSLPRPRSFPLHPPRAAIAQSAASS